MTTGVKEELIKSLKARLGEQQYHEVISEMQKSVDELRKQPQFRQYVEQHKMGLLDSRFRTLDLIMDAGIIR